MSLDVYLYVPTEAYDAETGETYEERATVYSRNITHNLGKMAKEAGVYYACWRPEEIDARKASDIVELLDRGAKLLRSNPEHYKQFDAPNGWGLHEHLLAFLEDYARACKKYPNTLINVSR